MTDPIRKALYNAPKLNRAEHEALYKAIRETAEQIVRTRDLVRQAYEGTPYLEDLWKSLAYAIQHVDEAADIQRTNPHTRG